MTTATAPTVCAIVVTYNRRDMLRRCLAALAAQERPADMTVVVDNASSDGTTDLVRDEFPDVELLALERNVGGAGGFEQGLAWAHARGFEWLWLMDDDTLTQPGTLGALLDGARRAPGKEPLIVCSDVRWKDERLHPMNVPAPRWRDRAQMAEAAGRGLLAVRTATFVSLAVHREAIDRYGLPLAHYFIWGDDIEFTARVLRHERGYLVPESRVYHWTPEPHAPAGLNSDRFYYHARNSLHLLRGSSFSAVERVDYGRYYLRSIWQFLRVNRRDRRRLGILLQGLKDGLRGPAR
ncbi:MAG TPA: glycosyltransferase family 2 protein [Baekduia sp.]|nr:glycosyltransferase family 2 protein [Baekduia sp.]